MNTPITHDPADDTKLYDGGKDAGHAVANTDKGHGHEGPFKDLKPMPVGVVIAFTVGLVVLLAILFVLGYIPRHQRRAAAEQEVKDISGKLIVGIARPKAPTAEAPLEVPGDAQAFQSTNLYPRTNGYLKKRLVDIGDRVKEGQLLAEIDAPEVTAQLAAAQAALQQTTAAATKAKDDFSLAEATYQRYENFAKTGGVTQQQLDEKMSALTSAKATLAGADANVKASEAEVQRLTALVSFTQIVAPFDGTITTRGYDVGALLTANNSGSGRELFQIAQTDMLRVFVDIPQSYATFVKVGQPVKFTVSNYPGRQFDGFIARSSGAINQASRTMRVEADVPNKDGALFPNMYGTLKYAAQQHKDQLMIPSSALIFGPEGLRVAVVDEQNKIRFQPVTLGVDLGIEVEVVNGLKASDRVVANPGERLADGIEVEVSQQAPPTGSAAPAMNANDNKAAENKAAKPSAETTAK